MESRSDLLQFFKSTERALKNNSLQELNYAISAISKKQVDKSDKIESILLMVSEQYQINKRDLIKKKARGKYQKARCMAYCLLHFDLNMNTRSIAVKFERWQNAVCNGINYYKRLDNKIKSDREFFEIYEILQKKIINENIRKGR